MISLMIGDKCSLDVRWIMSSNLNNISIFFASLKAPLLRIYISGLFFRIFVFYMELRGHIKISCVGFASHFTKTPSPPSLSCFSPLFFLP